MNYYFNKRKNQILNPLMKYTKHEPIGCFIFFDDMSKLNGTIKKTILYNGIEYHSDGSIHILDKVEVLTVLDKKTFKIITLVKP